MHLTPVPCTWHPIQARLGLRAAQGDRKMAVEHIMRRREEKEAIRKKEQEERRLGKLREKLGR